MNYAIVFLNEENWKTSMDTFTARNEAEARGSFRECYRHGKYRILTVVEIPEKPMRERIHEQTG